MSSKEEYLKALANKLANTSLTTEEAALKLLNISGDNMHFNTIRDLSLVGFSVEDIELILTEAIPPDLAIALYRYGQGQIVLDNLDK